MTTNEGILPNDELALVVTSLAVVELVVGALVVFVAFISRLVPGSSSFISLPASHLSRTQSLLVGQSNI
jgi:hypothetical protein